MSKLDRDGAPIPFGLTVLQQNFAQILRIVMAVNPKSTGLAINVALLAGHKNGPGIAVTASELLRHSRVRQYMNFLDDASGDLDTVTPLSHTEMKKIAANMARSAKNEGVRMKAVEVAQKLDDGDDDRMSKMTMDELLSQAAGGDPLKVAALKQAFDMEEDAA